MERQPHSNENQNEKVQISEEVYEGLEFIRRSGVTNMLDKPMVTDLAHEWGFDATAEWLENTDTRTYGRLIFMGPDVLPSGPAPHDTSDQQSETLDERLDRLDYEYDDERRAFWEEQ